MNLSYQPDLFLALAVLSFAASILAQYFLLRRLRHDHNETWTELGSRGVLIGATLRNNLRLAAFLWRRRYRQLHDPVVNRAAHAIWASSVAWLISIAIFLRTS
jgi:predicted permease